MTTPAAELPPTEEELVDYMRILRAAEVDGARDTVMLGPYTAIVLIGLLQLATRHPGIAQSQRDMVDQLIDGFKPWFVGTLGEQMIEMGFNPELDR